MSQKANNTKLGLFIIAGTGLFVGILVFLGAGDMFRERVEFETYFDTSVQGLDIGSPVKFRGAKIGSVTEITIVRSYYPEVTGKDGLNILVRMQVEQDSHGGGLSNQNARERTEALIASGMRVRLASQGITGLAFMEADFLGADAPPPVAITWQPEVLYVPSAPNQFQQITTSIESIARQLDGADLGTAVKDIGQLAATSRTQLEDLDLKALADRAKESLDHANNTFAKIEQFVDDPKVQGLKTDLPDTIQSIRASVDKLQLTVDKLAADASATLDSTRSVAESAERRINSEELDAMIDSARLFIDQLPAVVARFDDLAARLDTLVVQNGDKLADSAQNIRAATESLRSLADNLKQYPSLAILGEPPPPLEVYE